MHTNEHSVPRLDTVALRTFLAIADTGSVTRAAKALHRTQSAISVQIRQLEDALGSRLFTREPRGMALTTQGERLLASAGPIVAALDQAAADLVRDPVRGKVRVGIPDDYGGGLLTSVLAGFAQRHPLVEVEIVCGFSTRFPEALKRGELDLAIHAGERGDWRGEVLREEQTVWVDLPGSVASTIRPLPVALFDRACWWRDEAIRALSSAGIDYRIAYSSESVAGVKAAINAGLAVGVLANSTVDPTMRILSAAEGLPVLPSSSLVMTRRVEAKQPAVDAMAEAIRHATR